MQIRSVPYRAFVLGSCLFVFAACGSGDSPSDATVDHDARDDGEVDGSVDGAVECVGPPGLYQGSACAQLAAGVMPFRPRFQLWTDGASKERFIHLPQGETIDTSDPDDWVFPVGTRLYKHFSFAGQLVETRVMTKTSAGMGKDRWSYVAYAWNAEGTVVNAVPDGVINALGTGHDIPSSSACEACHTGGAVSDMSLGFSAIQLNHALPGVTLGSMQTEGWLSDAIDLAAAGVPGGAEVAAGLGYLHANCGHCHGGSSAPVGLRMRLLVADESVEGTDAYLTAVNVASGWQPSPTPAVAVDRIHPGDAASSSVYLRMGLRTFGQQMPPLGTKVVDASGREVVETMIAELASP